MREVVARLLSSRFVHRPIFQVGASRSGTIVLYKALGRHPAILSMPGENPLVDPLAGMAASFELGGEAWYFRESVKLDQPLLYARLRELIYETDLTNQDIARRMEGLGIRPGYDEVFADAAEPKSIEEIHRMGFNIKPASKGPGSVEFGHQLVRQYRQAWTKDSLNALKEQRNFRYIPDKNGKLTEKTTHDFSHLMDARRYAVVGKTDPGKPFMIG